MKKYLFFSALVAVGMISCSKEKTKDELVREKVEGMFIETMNDPSSYEFVKMVKIDSCDLATYFDRKMTIFEGQLEDAEYTIKKQEEYKSDDTFRFLYKEYEYEQAKKDYAEAERVINGLNQLKEDKKAELNKMLSYSYEFTCRGNNALGAKILNTFYFQTDETQPEVTIINIKDDAGNLPTTPVNLDEFLELIGI